MATRSPDIALQTQPIDAGRLTLGEPVAAIAIGRQVRRLPPGSSTLVGSGPDADLRVPCAHVSARHARVRCGSGGRLALDDLGSTNGSWMHGRRVEHATLAPGAAVLLARQPLLVGELGRSVHCPDAFVWQGIVARDSVSLETIEALARVAPSTAPVWVRGESGTGKESAARALHELGPRAGRPYVALNCAAMPETLAEAELFGVVRGAYTGADRSREGAFQRADGGTLLLDEVGELPPSVQAKLLRVLETGELTPVGGDRAVRVDVRIVTSTWRDLDAAAALGEFRFDLLQRLSVLQITLPPLRERRGDVPALLDHLLALHGGGALWPSGPLLEALVHAPWPGNVRQLRNHVLRAVASGDPCELLPVDAHRPGARMRLRRGQVPDAVGAARVRHAISRSDGNHTEAAQTLGISRSTLYRWLRASA